ncbi:MAG: hypothetical protein V1768_02905 [Patescibacteria group bacterium]
MNFCRDILRNSFGHEYCLCEKCHVLAKNQSCWDMPNGVGLPCCSATVDRNSFCLHKCAVYREYRCCFSQQVAEKLGFGWQNGATVSFGAQAGICC